MPSASRTAITNPGTYSAFPGYINLGLQAGLYGGINAGVLVSASGVTPYAQVGLVHGFGASITGSLGDVSSKKWGCSSSAAIAGGAFGYNWDKDPSIDDFEVGVGGPAGVTLGACGYAGLENQF